MKVIDNYLHNTGSQFLNQTLLATRYLAFEPMQVILARRSRLVGRLTAYFRGLSTDTPHELLSELAALMSDYNRLQRT